MAPFTSKGLDDAEAGVEVPEEMYDLEGIIIHHGTCNSGHYYSVIRDSISLHGDKSSTEANNNVQWYMFDDTAVYPLDKESIPDKCFGGTNAHGYLKDYSAYMLVYRKRSKALNQAQRATVRAHLERTVPPLKLVEIKERNTEFLSSHYTCMPSYVTFLVDGLQGIDKCSETYIIRFAQYATVYLLETARLLSPACRLALAEALKEVYEKNSHLSGWLLSAVLKHDGESIFSPTSYCWLLKSLHTPILSLFETSVQSVMSNENLVETNIAELLKDSCDDSCALQRTVSLGGVGSPSASGITVGEKRRLSEDSDGGPDGIRSLIGRLEGVEIRTLGEACLAKIYHRLLMYCLDIEESASGNVAAPLFSSTKRSVGREVYRSVHALLRLLGAALRAAPAPWILRKNVLQVLVLVAKTLAVVITRRPKKKLKLSGEFWILKVGLHAKTYNCPP